MSNARIIIIEVSGMDADSEYGLLRSLRDLIEQPRGGAAVVAAPAGDPEPASSPRAAEPPSRPLPRPAPAPPLRKKSQEQIELLVLDMLGANPDVELEQIAVAAYGEGDGRRRQKLTLTMRRLAKRGRVERLGIDKWALIPPGERDLEDEDDERDDDEAPNDGAGDDWEDPSELAG